MAFHSFNVGPSDSSTFPSIVIETRQSGVLARTHTSFCDGRLPQGSGTFHSGHISNGSMSRRTQHCLRILSISGGNPLLASQQWASVLADLPRTQCFSGSARRAFQSSGPLDGTRMRGGCRGGSIGTVFLLFRSACIIPAGRVAVSTPTTRFLPARSLPLHGRSRCASAPGARRPPPLPATSHDPPPFRGTLEEGLAQLLVDPAQPGRGLLAGADQQVLPRLLDSLQDAGVRLGPGLHGGTGLPWPLPEPLQRVRIRLASLARLLLLRARRPPSRGAARCARPRATAPLHSSKPPSGIPGAMMSLISTLRTALLSAHRPPSILSL